MHRSFPMSVNSRAGVYDGKIAGLYDLEETLGSGHFAVVKLARHVFTGEKVAVKVIEKTKLDDISRAHLFQEVRCMKLVQHPHVVRLYEVIDTQTKLYLILELGDGGDLYDYIMRHDKGLSESLAREYFRQIVRAISYCHQLHVVHRDLKPENVVFFEKLGVVKLTDFGFSNKFCPGQKLETSCGSLAYSAPEILLGDSYDAPAVDVWSLGVILYMLVCGHPPFQEANDSETLTMIMDCKYQMPPHVSDGCRRLISTMLVREPEKRATLHQIAQNEWLMEGSSSEETPEYLPLVSREQVSDDDHTLIIQRMINGKIATKEEILEALDRNEYNHITATYFLLAERKLRAHRQEQAMKQKPELSLPNNSQRMQSQDYSQDKDQNSMLLQVNPMHLHVPRPPGTESVQIGRSRKCSIVQEEEDDEDDVPCAGHEELSPPLNRRGSRSEGRISITVQDRLAESERVKKENKVPSPAPPSKSAFVGIGKVTMISSGSNNTEDRLGIAVGAGLNKKYTEVKKNEPNRKVAILKPSIQRITETNLRSSSLDKCPLSNKENSDFVNTKIITDSSTITLPIPSINLNQEPITVPKYKTMPSPTRTAAILAANAIVLNEIFEEGSSDSTSTTPRPLVRSQITNLGNNNVQRRIKFHKSRTASCSSSDASDDDSENRKKRAHKIVDSVTKPIPQRRDSHDDSSDSQDQGTAPSAGGTQANKCMIITANSTTSNGQEKTEKQDTNSTESSHQKTTTQQMDFRRHRGRRRPVETRLRESQSLNRITEVQESEISSAPAAITHSESPRAAINSQSNNLKSPCNQSQNTNPAAKPKGLSARILHTFKKQHGSAVAQTTPKERQDEIEMVLGVELSKALNGSENKEASSKRFKILGRYFQVHKKIYVPLSGLFQRGRLYKAQSCGSLVRDKVNVNQRPNQANSARHSTVFGDKNRIIKDCLTSSRLLGSDGDINHNASVVSMLSSNVSNTAGKPCKA